MSDLEPTPVDVERSPPMVRPVVPAAEALIGQRTPVLDHGFVVLVDYMGNDSAIVQAARVSYGLGTKSTRDDRGLIRYLMRHRHTTPFEMVEFKFLVKLPIFVARQAIRHRTFSVNELSARYSVVPDEFHVPEAEDIRAQSRTNRQGRGDALPSEVVGAFRDNVRRTSEQAYQIYEQALERGVTRELARILLPVNFYTQWYWKANLHNLLHFLSLRLDAHAQEEIRRYAQALVPAVKAVTPIAYEAFEDFVLNSEHLTRREKVALRAMLEGASAEEACTRAKLPWRREDGTLMRSGEGVEFLEKLRRIRDASADV